MLETIRGKIRNIRKAIQIDLLAEVNLLGSFNGKRRIEYLNWIYSDLVELTNEFVEKNALLDSYFTKSMNKLFDTDRFNPLLKKWIVEYLSIALRCLDEMSYKNNINNVIVLEDNPLNRFAAEKYLIKFKTIPPIKWKNQPSTVIKLLNLLIIVYSVFCVSLFRGIKLFLKVKKFKVMTEAVSGLHTGIDHCCGDDFFVDDKNIKKEDLLLYSRGIYLEGCRLVGYNDAINSDYEHFVFNSLPMGLKQFIFRVLPKYVFSGVRILINLINSNYYTLFYSVFYHFKASALQYEKIFSNYKITSELGYSFYSFSHIAESIVCQNYGSKYYLFHWSDLSVDLNKSVLSFLGCDKYFLWGKAHVKGVEGPEEMLLPIGFFNKRYIKESRAFRHKILADAGIDVSRKVVSFFDESFGIECKMTEDHFVIFYEIALKMALLNNDLTILLKPKVPIQTHSFSDGCREKLDKIIAQLNNLNNVYILNPKDWSYVKVIGISDIVVTQGMTSSSTIAIISGVEGLYFDQVHYNHPFSKIFKDKLVFDDPDKLIEMTHKIILGEVSPLKDIPYYLLREYDECPDDRSIELLQEFLINGYINQRKVGIIIQARMGSTRLPGKIMLPVQNKPVLEHIIDRLKGCKNVHEIIIATTIDARDDLIVSLAKSNNLKYFRGSEEDVLSRYYYAAKENNLDVIIRITSDCPFVDADIIDSMVATFLKDPSVDYLSNTIKRTFPRGLDVEIMNFSSLKKAFNFAKENCQREHVTPYIYQNEEKFKIKQFIGNGDDSKYRLTLDTQEDFELIREIYDGIYPVNNYFTLNDVLRFLKQHDHLTMLNSHIVQKGLAI